MRDRTDKAFIIGFGVALADLNRLHDDPVACKDTITGAGYELADFEAAGLEEYDLAELRKIMGEG